MKNLFKRHREPFAVASVLTPKNIIMTAVKDKLKGTGVVKIVLMFFMADDTYNLMLQNSGGESMNIDVTKNEISTIKKLFVRRIISKWNERYDIDPHALIVQIDIPGEAIEIFIQDHKKDVHKFNF